MNLKIENLYFNYNQKVILENFNLNISSGQRVWLKGRSGIGKSTLLKLIAGLLPVNEGSLIWNNVDFSKISTEERDSFRKDHIAYLNQENHLISTWSIEKNLKLVLTDDGFSKAQYYLNSLGFTSLDLKKKVKYLSGGEKQKVNLLMGIFQGKSIYLFDEPTAHLDHESMSILFDILSKQNITAIIVSHDESVGRFLNQIVEFSK